VNRRARALTEAEAKVGRVNVVKHVYTITLNVTLECCHYCLTLNLSLFNVFLFIKYSFIGVVFRNAVINICICFLWLYNIANFKKKAKQHIFQAIRDDPELRKKVLGAYKMMLDFYGLELVNRVDGTVGRQEDCEERLDHLNRYTKVRL